jgi:hypothetical protein
MSAYFADPVRPILAFRRKHHRKLPNELLGVQYYAKKSTSIYA